MAPSPWALHLHPQVLLPLIGLTVAYLVTVRRMGPIFHPHASDPPITPRQITAFMLGIVTLWLALGWPLHDIAERRLYSAHMVQHLLLAMVAPGLLLLGTPPWLAQLLVRPRWIRAVLAKLSRPVPALVVFNVVLVASHWPAAVDLMLRSEGFHAGAHLALLAASVVLWMPVVSPLPDVPRLSPPGRMGYLLLQTFVPTVPASFLTFGTTPLYRSYEPLPRLWGLSPLNDMRISGLIMKIGGGLLLWTIVAVMFFRWSRDEEAAPIQVASMVTPQATPTTGADDR